MAFQVEILVCDTPYGDLQKIFFGSPMGATLDSSLDINLVSRGSKSLKMVPGAYLGLKFCDFEIGTNLGHWGICWKVVLQKDHVVRNG